jgi:hypothetical protein
VDRDGRAATRRVREVLMPHNLDLHRSGSREAAATAQHRGRWQRRSIEGGGGAASREATVAPREETM